MHRRGAALVLSLTLLLLAGTVRSEELAERDELLRRGEQAYRAGQFAELDAILDGYRVSRERTSSGLWKLGLVRAGVEQARAAERPRTAQDWQRAEAKASDWQSISPTSPSACINLADVIVSHAWSIRGGKYASQVPESAWAPFHAELARASATLDACRKFAAVDPDWFELSLVIAKAAVDALFEEVTTREPGYYPVYFAMLDYLLPKWNGDLHQIEVFANQATEKTRSFEGGSMYARIYWYAAQVQFDNGLFMSSFAHWSKVDAGFKDIVARYPDQWNINHYAKFACLAGEYTTVRRLFDRITQPIPEAWEPSGLYESCRQRAGILTL